MAVITAVIAAVVTALFSPTGRSFQGFRVVVLDEYAPGPDTKSHIKAGLDLASATSVGASSQKVPRGAQRIPEIQGDWRSRR
jgi:hypothetical protein